MALILSAGLFPVEFHPENRVDWLDPGPGLRFERGGIAFSDEALGWEAGAAEVSVELWLVPGDEPDGRLGQIFSLYDGEPVEPLLVAQWKSGLVVRDRVIDERGRMRARELGSLGLLFRDQRRGIAVTSGPGGTAVYLDGVESDHRSSIPLVAAGESFGGNAQEGASPDSVFTLPLGHCFGPPGKLA